MLPEASTHVVELAAVNVMRGCNHVLHNVSLSIRRGEQIAILGPNGCGKSTLLKVMTCELYPRAAKATSVRLFGRAQWELAELKRRLGVVQSEVPGEAMQRNTASDAVLTGFFSSSTLWPHLEVTKVMRERAAGVMALLGIDDLRLRLFGELSSGQQRRVLIARALVASAECLLLDEPSNALDLAAQRELRALLRALAQQGTTIVHITHHVADLIPEMSRVVLMKAGRIFADGDRSALLTASALSDLFATEVRLAEQDGYLHAW